MPDVICGNCNLWASGAEVCRVTSDARISTDSCNLTVPQRLGLVKQSRAIVAGYREESDRKVVTITGLQVCAGGGHLTVTGNINGTERQATYEMDEIMDLTNVPPREQLLRAIVEFVRLCDANTMAEASTALDGQVFYV